MNSIAQSPKARKQLSISGHQAAERTARLVATRPWKTEAQRTWLLNQANHHRDQQSPNTNADSVLERKRPPEDNKWRMKKKADRVEAISVFVEGLEPGTEFTADAVRGWWIENRPPGDLVPTVAVIRRDTATYLEDGYLEIVPKVRQSAPMMFWKC